MTLDPEPFYAVLAAVTSGLTQFGAPLWGPTERDPPGAPSALAERPGDSRLLKIAPQRKLAELLKTPFCGNLSNRCRMLPKGHLRRAIYQLVYSIADARVHSILLNRMDC